jgi:HSP20 family molecular chaperone IbpA
MYVAKVELQDGVLNVHIPKVKTEQKPKAVEIKVQ